nr:VP6 [Colorado tick fever virus]
MAASGWNAVIPKTSSYDYITVSIQPAQQDNKKNLVIEFPPVSYFYGVYWTTDDMIIVRLPASTTSSQDLSKMITITKLRWTFQDQKFTCVIGSDLAYRIILTCNIGTMYFTATFVLNTLTSTGTKVYGMFNYVSLSSLVVIVTDNDAAHVEALIAVEGAAVRNQVAKLILWSVTETTNYLSFEKLISKAGKDVESGYYKGDTKTKRAIQALSISQGESWYYVELCTSSPLDVGGSGLAFFMRIRGVGLRSEPGVTPWKVNEIFKPPTSRLESDFSYSIHPEAQEDDSVVVHKAHLLAQNIIRDLGYKTVAELDTAEDSHLPVGSADCLAALLDLLYRRSEEMTLALNRDYKPRRRQAAIAPQIQDPAVPSIQTYQNLVAGMLGELSKSQQEVLAFKGKFDQLERKVNNHLAVNPLTELSRIKQRVDQFETSLAGVSSAVNEVQGLRNSHGQLSTEINRIKEAESHFLNDLESVRRHLQGETGYLRSQLGNSLVTIFKPIIKMISRDIGMCLKVGSTDQSQNDVVALSSRVDRLTQEVTALQNSEKPRLFYLHDKSEIKAAAGALEAVAAHVYLGWMGQRFICPSVLGSVYHHDRYIQGVYYRLVACTIEMVHFDKGTMILLIRDEIPPVGVLHEVESNIVLDQCDHVPGIVRLSRDRVSPVDYIEVYEVVDPGVFTLSFSHVIAIYIPRCSGLRLLP